MDARHDSRVPARVRAQADAEARHQRRAVECLLNVIANCCAHDFPSDRDYLLSLQEAGNEVAAAFGLDELSFVHLPALWGKRSA